MVKTDKEVKRKWSWSIGRGVSEQRPTGIACYCGRTGAPVRLEACFKQAKKGGTTMCLFTALPSLV